MLVTLGIYAFYWRWRVGIQQTIEPVLVLVLMFVLAIPNGAYLQDHLNRGWDAATGKSAGGPRPLLPAPPG
jgi:hypothetical protein